MKSILVQFALILACALAACPVYGQDSLGPTPKRARTPADYKPRTLKSFDAEGFDAESRGDREDRIKVQGDILPSRVRAKYLGFTRPLPAIKRDVLRQWARLYAGAPEHYTVPYERELLFSQDGTEHWLAVRKDFIAQFKKQKRHFADLFLIRLGAARLGQKWETLLLVESFQKAK